MFAKFKNYLRKHTEYGKTRYLHFLYSYDQKRYYAHSSMDVKDGNAVACRMRLLIHAIEKGLSLKETKPEFGKSKIEELLSLIDQYESMEDRTDGQVLEMSRSLIWEYANFRVQQGEDVSFIPKGLLDQRYLVPAGAIDYEHKKRMGFEEIARNRHSVREFSDEALNLELLWSAVSLAQTAPSACNRQSSHVYVCTDKEKIQNIMQRHRGTRGFTFPGGILALTGDLRMYQNEYERNTVFVDGGLFLMNLLYALDRYDIAACPVIWGAEPDNDAFLYELMKIPESHEIISLVLIGNYPKKTVKIPCSARREVTDVLHFTDNELFGH